MRYIADLHLHSRFSRACSKDLTLSQLNYWAKIKGLGILATADWTHPGWLKELKSGLKETKPGLFQLNDDPDSVYFILGTELSCIYSDQGKVRRLHLCLYAPSFQAVDKIISCLEKRGVNLKSDGRPIMGLSARELAKIAFDADSRCLVIPAHAWTPWFSVFGSYSGYDSLEQCFGEEAKNIYAIETGLSSDPPMNWQVSALDKLTLLSNSDAHSPSNLGREANVFEMDSKHLSYDELARIIREKDRTHFLYTIEFFPEEGKYHHDGHADCKVNLTPKDTKKHQGLCPVCRKPLTIGVLNRVSQLADRNQPNSAGQIGYKSLVPLAEIIAEILGQGKNTKKVLALYFEMIKKAGSEFGILLDSSEKELSELGLEKLADCVMNVRLGKITPVAGYDGIYGTISVLSEAQKKIKKQKTLF